MLNFLSDFIIINFAILTVVGAGLTFMSIKERVEAREFEGSLHGKR